ncbi:uncharacterized protein LOC117176324 [Belonocnema kinseyi]|uniref:uncharacterized protein LOC117176324 n=1 Tax=Belonocnema kinseyi TaxID=2817044 RepID=UPI00143DCE71|nr:uncharacterized protein LOC117176324 [Belonocnema kinseyi]XP_033222443.1 uncharacterized protein LOC117176324 [Belonocnema kinseyi]
MSPNRLREPNPGATFQSIVRYVMDHSRITEDKARYLTIEVLKAGMAMGKIKRTPVSTYFLTTSKPPPLVNRIRDPRLSDDSEDTLSDLSN